MIHDQNLLLKTLIWLCQWKQISCAILMFSVVLSGIGVTFTSHQIRQVYARLQVVNLNSDNLDSHYEKLLLEQSAWADYSRVDQISRKVLAMRSPDIENIVIVNR